MSVDWLNIIMGAVFGGIGTVITGIATRYYTKLQKFSLSGIFIRTKHLAEKFDKEKNPKTKLGIELGHRIPGWKEHFTSFDTRESDLYESLKNNKSVRIIEEAGRGKTRTALEVIRRLTREKQGYFKKVMLIFINPGSKFEPKSITKKWLIWKYSSIFLFFDDIDKYAENPAIPEYIGRIRQVSKNTQLLCTCRSEKWGKIPGYASGIIEHNFPTLIEINPLENEEGRKLAKDLEMDFPSLFGGNAAEIVLEKIKKEEEYKDLKQEKKSILYSLKLLNHCKIVEPDKDLLRVVSCKMFQVLESSWHSFYEQLKQAEFFSEIDRHIRIPDIYLQDIITEYLNEEEIKKNSDHFVSELVKLRDILREIKNYKKLFPISFFFVQYDHIDHAFACFPEEKDIKNLKFETQFSYYLYRSEIYISAYRLEEARLDLEHAEEFAKLTQDYLQIGVSYARSKEQDKAIRVWNKAISMNPKDVDTLKTVAISAALLDIEEYAIQKYEQVLKLNPYDTIVLGELSRLKVSRGEWTTAKELAERALEIQPDDGNLLRLYGHALLFLNEIDKALNYILRAIEQQPDKAELYVLLGTIYYSKKMYEQSLSPYEKAVKLDPFSDRNNFSLGLAYMANNMHEKAIEHLEKAIQLGFDKATCYNSLGEIYTNIGDHKNAQLMFEKAVEKDPYVSLFHLNLGKQYIINGNYEEARNSLESAEELDKENGDIYLWLGIAYKFLSQWDIAKTTLETSYKFKKRDKILLLSLGEVYSNINESQRALKYYKMSLEIDPDYLFAYISRGSLYANLGEYEKAVQDINKVIEIESDNSTYYLNRGWYYFLLKEYTLSHMDFSKSIEIDPMMALAFANRSMVNFAIEEIDLAMIDLEEAANKDPKALVQNLQFDFLKDKVMTNEVAKYFLEKAKEFTDKLTEEELAILDQVEKNLKEFIK